MTAPPNPNPNLNLKTTGLKDKPNPNPSPNLNLNLNHNKRWRSGRGRGGGKGSSTGLERGGCGTGDAVDMFAGVPGGRGSHKVLVMARVRVSGRVGLFPS